MLSYIFFRITVFLLSFLPFRLLYGLSDILSFVLYRLLKYRYAVIYDNLTKSFPDKNPTEIELLVKGAYRNFCDILLEGLKGMGMSDAQLLHRYKVKNPTILDSYFEKNQDVILATAHYANWEWGITLGLSLPHYVVVPYKPLKNKYINAFVERSRSFDNLVAIPKNKSFEYMNQTASKPRSLALIADQSPVKTRDKHWVDFFGRDTAFLHGPDTFAREYNAPLLYLKVQRVARGKYESEIHVLQEDTASCEEGVLTRLYAQFLEQQIREKPENWLWTHKRWKRTREAAASKKM